MDPMMLQMIQQLLQSQGGAFGLPMSNINPVFEQAQSFMNENEASSARKRLNVDPLRDITPFRVNSFRGFLAQKGGTVHNESAEEFMPNSFQNPSAGMTPVQPIMSRVRSELAFNELQSLVNGGSAGQIPTIPASGQLDTINNTPSNVPGGAGGKFDISMLSLQDNNPFAIPKMQPFVDPIFGNKLFDSQAPVNTFKEGGFVETLLVEDDTNTKAHLDLLEEFQTGGSVDDSLVYVPVQFSKGGPVKVYGVEKAFLGKLIKGIGKGIGKVGKGIFEGFKGLADWQLGLFGAPDLIGNSFVDRSKILSKVNSIGGGLFRTAADFVIPGLGSAIGAGGSLLNKLGKKGDQASSPTGGGFNLGNIFGSGAGGQGPGVTPITGSLFDRINQRSNLPSGGLFQGQFNGSQGPIPNMGGLFGQLPMGNAQVSVPGFAGGMFSLPGRTFKEGGPVESEVKLVPIQTEKVGKQPEMIIHLDGSITPVNATRRHSQMDPDEVTDIVPEGSYITSADTSMKITYKEAKEAVVGIKTLPYKEALKGKVPETVTLAELWGKGRSPLTPAQLTQRVMRKMPLIDMSDHEHGSDIFTKRTNLENLQTRGAFLSEIARLNEEKRLKKEGTGSVSTFKHGGSPVRVPNLPHAQFGSLLQSILQIAPTAIPALASIFGAGNQNRQGVGGVSPLVTSGILGSIPLSQLGTMQNINAQSGALNQAVDDFSSLGNQLIQNAERSAGIQLGANQQGVGFALQGQNALGQANLASTGLGALNAFATPTDQERLNLGAARSRINNFRPRSASRAAIDAAATPQIDQQALATLGPRAAPLLAQAESDRLRAANMAAVQRNQFLDQTEQNRIGQLNQLDERESLFNIGQGSREQDLERARNAQLFGSLQQGFQNAGQLQANQFGIMGQGAQRAADLQSGLLGQMGQIQSQILPITTQFALQNAGLAGQGNISAAQNALNAFTTLGGIQSQNALAQQLPPSLGGQQPRGDGLLGGLGQLLGGLFNNNPRPDAVPFPSDLGINPSSRDEFNVLSQGIRPQLQTQPMFNLPTRPITPVSQADPFCSGGIHIVTGQPC